MSLQILMQVRRERDSKFNFYMATLLQLKQHSNQIEDKIEGIQNWLLHAAPEALDNWAWNSIYNLCRQDLSDNNKCVEIYANKMEEFKQKFDGILK